jgi:hypothetical protein
VRCPKWQCPRREVGCTSPQPGRATANEVRYAHELRLQLRARLLRDAAPQPGRGVLAPIDMRGTSSVRTTAGTTGSTCCRWRIEHKRDMQHTFSGPSRHWKPAATEYLRA